MAGIEEELSALATMSSAQLRAEWQRVMRTPPPPAFSADLLELAIAYQLQVKRYGGLPGATRRRLDQLAREVSRSGSIASASDTSLRPGTRLSRDWHGKTHHVLVLDDGYMFEDRRYRSLTQIAASITGTAWSGPRFFGLKQRKAEAAHGKV
jgi:hypothetical protein